MGCSLEKEAGGGDNNESGVLEEELQRGADSIELVAAVIQLFNYLSLCCRKGGRTCKGHKNEQGQSPLFGSRHN